MNRYYKNFILCGDIEQYCLLCKDKFSLILDIEKHVRSENHRRQVEKLSCVPQFQKDLIYKIQINYYCAICNLIMKNLSIVKKHIKTADHKLLKQRPDAIIKKPVGTYNGGIVTIDKITLNRLEWNSVTDNTCHICHVNMDNIYCHIESEEHIIRLIQCTTNYTNNQYYRKLNNDHFHCFACKKIFFTPNFLEHWIRCENNDHAHIRQLRQARDEDIISAAQGTSKMAGIKVEFVNSLQGHYTFDDTEKAATCKYCPITLPLKVKSLMKHMKEMHLSFSDSSNDESDQEAKKVKKTVRDSGLKRCELAKYGEKLYIKLNHNGSRGYCNLCDVYVPPHKMHFKTHCKGFTHRGFLEIIGKKKPKLRELSLVYSWLSFKSYVISVQNSPLEPAFWINKIFFIDIDSFFYIRTIQVDAHYKKIKCLACVDYLKTEKVFEHCASTKHRTVFNTSRILCKSDEFIREIQPHFYHCGFCNVTLPYSKALEDHMGTKKHIIARGTKTLRSRVPNFIRSFNPNFMDISMPDDMLYRYMLRLAGDICAK